MANTVARISVTHLPLNKALPQLYTAKTTREVTECIERAHMLTQSNKETNHNTLTKAVTATGPVRLKVQVLYKVLPLVDVSFKTDSYFQRQFEQFLPEPQHLKPSLTPVPQAQKKPSCGSLTTPAIKGFIT